MKNWVYDAEEIEARVMANLMSMPRGKERNNYKALTFGVRYGNHYPVLSGTGGKSSLKWMT